MNSFIAVLLLAVASASAAVQPIHQHQGNNEKVVTQYAEDRDATPGGSYTVPTSTFVDNGSQGFVSTGSSFQQGQPALQQYNSQAGGAYYNENPSSYHAQGLQGGFGNGASLFPVDLIQTGLSIVLGIFAFSLVVQILTKVAKSNIFDDLFDKGRAMSSDDMVHYTNMVMEAYSKFDQMNQI